MFGRVTTVEVPVGRVSDAVKGFEDQAVGTVKKLKGFKKAYLLVDRNTGKSYAIFLFDSAANLKASTDRASEVRTQVTQAVGAKVISVEEFEMAAQS